MNKKDLSEIPEPSWLKEVVIPTKANGAYQPLGSFLNSKEKQKNEED